MYQLIRSINSTNERETIKLCVTQSQSQSWDKSFFEWKKKITSWKVVSRLNIQKATECVEIKIKETLKKHKIKYSD